MSADELASRWDLPIEPPLTVDPEQHPWSEAADLVVVGVGGAGIAAALEALEHGASVIALDRYGLGGSTKANGGVFYAGGGTALQRQAGEQDTAEEMFRYLKLETDGVVQDETLRRFCDESVETVDWLLRHGAQLSSALCKDKTSYPPLDKFLYHSDSSWPRRMRDRPSRRRVGIAATPPTARKPGGSAARSTILCAKRP